MRSLSSASREELCEWRGQRVMQVGAPYDESLGMHRTLDCTAEYQGFDLIVKLPRRPLQLAGIAGRNLTQHHQQRASIHVGPHAIDQRAYP